MTDAGIKLQNAARKTGMALSMLSRPPASVPPAPPAAPPTPAPLIALTHSS